MNSRVKSTYNEEREMRRRNRNNKKGSGNGRDIRRRTNLIPASPSGVPFMMAWIMFRSVIGMVVFMNGKV